MKIINKNYLNKYNDSYPHFSNQKTIHLSQFKFLILPFIIGFIATQKIIFGGEIYLGEFMAILYLIFHTKRKKFSIIEKRLFQLAIVWSIAQLISDMVNDTNLLDSFKGVLAPIIFSTTILGVIAYFRNNFKLMPSFLLGVTIGALLSVVFFPDLYAQGNPWKWGLGSGIVEIIAIYTSFFQRGKNVYFLIISLSIFFVISILFDARTLATFPLISMLLYFGVKTKKVAPFIKLFRGNWGVIRLLCLIIPILLVTNLLLSSIFSSEAFLSHLSDEAAQKSRVQATGEYGILLGGRSEILISSKAFFDSPLLGHGSWAHDKNGIYISEYLRLVSQLGYSQGGDNAGEYEIGLIPVHSYIMGGLVWAGILGGLFWIFLINIVVINFIKFMPELSYYYYLGILILLWNIFFSPFGAFARWNTAIFLSSYFAFIFELIKQKKRAV